MLRVTLHETSDSVTVQFEGKLVGPWVQEAEGCWRRCLAERPNIVRRFDLKGVTMIDAAGKAFLTAAHAQGTTLISSGCLMRAVVAEITGDPFFGSKGG